MESTAERENRIARLAVERAVRRVGGVEDRDMTRANLPAVMLPSTGTGAPVTPTNALGVSAVFACVRALADAAASLPLHVFRKGADGGREREQRHPTARLLDRPAPAVPTGLLVWQIVAHLNLHGEAFVGLYAGESGEVAQLGCIAPELVEVDVIGGLPVYTITRDGRRESFGPDSIVHVRGMMVDGVRGVSPIKAARESLGYARSLAEHGSAAIRNGARPSGVLRVPDGPGWEETAQQLTADFAASAGGGRVGSVVVLNGETSFSPIAMTTADARYVEQRQLSDQEVARIFRVPGSIVGVGTGDSMVYSTVAEQLRAFVVFGLRPWLAAIEGAFAACERLFPAGSGLYPAFQLEGLLSGDPAARATFYTAALNQQTGWMTRAEVRAREDLPAEREPIPTAPKAPTAAPTPLEATTA